MNPDLMISRVRLELRRKNASFTTERNTVRWIKTFFKTMSLTHSSQIEWWQMEVFLSAIADQPSHDRDDLLQAQSSLLLLFNRVLKRSGYFLKTDGDREWHESVIKITA